MKERLDVILTSLGLAESREKAKAIIMSGNVYVDGQREDKAGAMFDREKLCCVSNCPTGGAGIGG